jgi:hypothetical protein
MLFDLRGRGRRRTVRLIYAGLALVMGVGLVGFGIGGGFGGGGLLNAAENNGGGSSASFSSEVAKYRKLTRAQPTNPQAWEGLTKAQLHEAGGTAYVTETGITSKGRELFSQTAQSWNSYMALNPPKPNAELAQLMVRVFGAEGLNEPAKVVQVLQIVVAARPTSAALFAALAQYAYLAHNVRVGDLAGAKAISLVPAAQRARVKLELTQAKNKALGKESSAAGTTSVGTAGAVVSPTATSTTSAPATPGKTTSTKK